jgi:hypothetical protein
MISNLIKSLKQLPRHGQSGVASAGNMANVTRSSTSLPTSVSPTAAASNSVSAQVQQLAQQLAQQMVAQQNSAANVTKKGRVFTTFDQGNDIVKNQIEVVTGGVWSNGSGSLATMFTSSAQTISQRRYYTDVYNELPDAESSAVQFSVAYGHALGSGSIGTNQDSPSKAVYSQYRQLLLNPTDTRFTTAGSGSTDSIYIVNFKRNRLKERLDAGNFELPIKSINTRVVNATGSITLGSLDYTFIDDSSLASAIIGDSGRKYNLVSGSIANGVYNPTNPVYYGLVYPDFGTIIVDGKMLDQQLAFKTNLSSSIEGNNHFALFRAMSGSANDFQARNSEKITSTHYFVRIKNAEYNFSNNPSYITGSVGQLAEASFVGDPKTYITTVGLYNSKNELLAVAKLSQPLLKSFQREALLRVKLDY